MKPSLRSLIKAVSLKNVSFLFLFCFSLFYFLASLGIRRFTLGWALAHPYGTTVLSIGIFLGFFVLWLLIAKTFAAEPKTCLTYGLTILCPVVLLFLWPGTDTEWSFFIPMGIVAVLQSFVYRTLLKQGSQLEIKLPSLSFWLVLVCSIYAVCIFLFLLKQFQAHALYNPRDFAIYNQIFWNTLNGNFFLSSDYGVYFTSHNVVFFMFLIPLYFIYPHLLTLSVLQLLFFLLSLIPICLLLRKEVNSKTLFLLCLTFLFYPALIAQHFTPPHEIGFVPFFALFTYYFYKRERFGWFLVFLTLCLFQKEHVIFLPVMFAGLALLERRASKWFLVPVLFTVTWGLISWLAISYAKSLYPEFPLQTWLIDDLKIRFFSGDSIGESLRAGWLSSNAGSWYRVQGVLDYFSPLGLLLPFLSPVSFLGIPEMLLCLLSDRTAVLHPTRHYNILFSCFLILGTFEVILKIKASKFADKVSLERETLPLILSGILFGAVLMHSPLWLDLIPYGHRLTAASPAALDTALESIPQEASVTVPAYLAPAVSSRRDYSLLGQNRLKEYVLLDLENIDRYKLRLLTEDYHRVYSTEEIRIYKKT